MADRSRVAVVAPVYRNAETLEELVARVGAALDGRDWRLRLVVDACPDGSAEVARRLVSDRVRVTVLDENVGQHAALARGLADEDEADAWACLDADLQDPPEALPALLDALPGVDVVFAGRRGDYESPVRLLTGRLHRAAVRRLTGLPPDAGAFLACGPAGRDAVLTRGAPSVVLAMAGLRAASLPVVRSERPVGRSAWTAGARLRQSARSLSWAATSAGRRGSRSSR